MSISHHPGEDLLLDYASGSLDENWSLAVATHLALCPKCRRLTSEFEAVGGGMISTATPSVLSDHLFNAIMSAVDSVNEEALVPNSADETGQELVFPQPLRKYVGADARNLNWQRLGLNAHQLKISTFDNSTTIRLLKIPAGRPVPTHSHNGRELTLVLSGAFSDITGTYGRGDMQDIDESAQHQPRAVPGKDCICLFVTDQPLKFKSLAARVAQPFLGI